MRTVILILTLMSACQIETKSSFRDLGPFPESLDVTWEYVGTCNRELPLGGGSMPDPGRYTTIDTRDGRFMFQQPAPVGWIWPWRNVVFDQNAGTMTVPEQYVLEFDNTDCPDEDPLLVTDAHEATIDIVGNELTIIGVVGHSRGTLCIVPQPVGCHFAWRYVATATMTPPAAE